MNCAMCVCVLYTCYICSVQAKEQVKKRNVELMAEQKLLMTNWKELELAEEKQFGDQIRQAAERIEALEKEIENTSQERNQIEYDMRYT